MKKLYTDLNEDCPAFYCYSINLYRYLKNSGLRYEDKFISSDTGKTCWVFKRTELFEMLYKSFGIKKFDALGYKNKFSKNN